jgi:hypothetical protein
MDGRTAPNVVDVDVSFFAKPNSYASNLEREKIATIKLIKT